MANNEDKLSRLYREGLENFAKDPPPQVWAGIKQGLLIKNLVTLKFLTSLNIYSVSVFVAAAAVAGFFAGNQLQQKNNVAETNKAASSIVTEIPSKTQEIKTTPTADQVKINPEPSINAENKIDQVGHSNAPVQNQTTNNIKVQPVNTNKPAPSVIYQKPKEPATQKENTPKPTDIGAEKSANNATPKNEESLKNPLSDDKQILQEKSAIENKESQPDPTEKTAGSSKTLSVPKKPKTGQGFYTEIFGAPAFVTYTFEESAVNPNLTFVETSKEDEKPALSYTAGLELGYGLKNIFAQTGLNYSDYRSKSLIDLIVTESKWTDVITKDSTWWYRDSMGKDYFKYNFDTVQNLTTNDTTITHSSTNSMRYIEIPILIGYRFYGKRISCALSGGISFGYLISSGGQTLNPDLKSLSANTPSDIPFRQWTENLIFRAEVAYLFKQNFSVFIRPGFKYNLNSVFEEHYPVQKSFYAIDLHLGLRYNF